MSSRPLTIFFSVGEPSGDLHGANLIRQLQRRHPQLQAVGYGGPNMAAAGCQLHADLTALAVMAFTRVLVNIHHFWGLVSRADRYFRHHRPDAVVLIDYPGFNWWIARRAKVHGIPVYYYTPPQIWAWAQWRVKKMRRLVDHVLCSLPFEEPWLRSHGCRATFVGHPFFDEIARQEPDPAFMARHRAQSDPLVTILPGSRTQEVLQNLPVFLKAAAHISREEPRVRFAIAAFKDRQAEMARQAVAASGLPIEICVGRTPELIRLADCCMACSGSVSLELLYQAKPTVIHYCISPVAHWLKQYVLKVKYFTLVNLLNTDNIFVDRAGAQEAGQQDAEDLLYPEYLNDCDRAPQIARHIVDWLRDPAARAARVAALEKLRRQVGHGGASSRAAEYIMGQLAPPTGALPAPHFLSVAAREARMTKPE